MTIDTRYQRALNFAKSGKLEEAQNILLTLETPEAERLLERVNKALAARNRPAMPAQINKEKFSRDAQAVKEGIKAYEQEKFRNGCMVALLLFVCMFSCAMYGAYMGAPRPAENVAKMCQQIEALNFRCDAEQVMRDYPNDVAFCQATVGNWDDERPYRWEGCFFERGIDFPPNN